MTRKPPRWLVVTLGVLVVLCLALWLFDWNLLRGPIERRVQAATGREFSIRGDLDVKLRWHPVVSIDDVTLGNASWSEEPRMVQLEHAEITVNPWSLLRGRIELPALLVRGTQVQLEKNAEGIANWQFDTQQQSADTDASPLSQLTIGRLTVDRAQLRYLSPIEQADVRVIASSTASDRNPHLLQVNAEGRYLAVPAQLEGRIGMISSAEDLKNSYPFHLTGEIARTRVKAIGSVAEPMRLNGLDLDFELAGQSMADLFPLLGVPLPPTPEYGIAGRLTQSGASWNLREFKGHVGSSDLRGEFLLDRGRTPQFISADLQSDNLALDDLSGLIGARKESGEKIQQPDKVLPHSPFNFEKLNAANAEVKFRGRHIKTTRLPIEDLNAVLKLQDGNLKLEPISLGLAEGTAEGTLHIAAGTPLTYSTDIRFRKVRLEALLPGVDLKKANAGVIGGRMQLTGQGNSVAAMLGSADGQVALVMQGGAVSQLVVRLANLDVARTLTTLLGGDRSMPVRCMITDLKATDGVMRVNTMLLDTQKSLIEGSGSIDFAQEKLDLELKSEPKDRSLVALRGPIIIDGTFKNPSARPELKNVTGRAVLAAALGSLFGPLAFVPLLELGGGEDSDCGKLLMDVEQRFRIKTPAPPVAEPKQLPMTSEATPMGDQITEAF